MTQSKVRPLKIAILEDCAERIAAMRHCLADRLYMYEPRFFRSAREFVDWIGEHRAEVIAISLDHDLEPVEQVSVVDGNQQQVDPGNGQLVAEFLAGMKPLCPLVIHTSNSPAAAGMEVVLHESGWKTSRVLPYEDLHWISEVWATTIRMAIFDGAQLPDTRAGSAANAALGSANPPVSPASPLQVMQPVKDLH